MLTPHTVVVVARNNLHLTRSTVASALAQDIPTRVVIVDNASTDGTSAWLSSRTHADTATIYVSPQRSLAACWNLGLALAFRLGESALVLNNDVEIRPDAYRLLLAHGGPFVTCVSVGSISELRPFDQPTSESPHPDFSCFMIRSSVWQTVGRFDERLFPAYCEDADYHVRMHRAGIRAVSIDVPFLHHSASTLKHSTPQERLQIERGAQRNREAFAAEYGCLPGTAEYEALFA